MLGDIRQDQLGSGYAGLGEATLPPMTGEREFALGEATLPPMTGEREFALVP